MNINRTLMLGVLAGIFLTGTAFSQQIETNTSATTQGSTTFGYLPDAADLGVFMQSTVAPTCITVSTNVQTCTSDGGTAVGDNDNFVRVDQMPGSFTDSPIPGIVSALPNSACGATASTFNCTPGMTVSLAPSGSIGQTSPDFTGRQLVGNMNTNITVGDGGATAGMPDGFIAFTLNPATSDATIDQFITHSIDLGGGSLMVFNQRDATIGAGNSIPDPIAGPLTLLPFVAATTRDLAILPVTGMVSRLLINQGAADGFGALDIDVQVDFPGFTVPGATLLPLPFPGTYVTPGLNTGINPTFPPPLGFGSEWNGFAFP